MHAIEFHNLSKRYGARNALDGVTIQLPEGASLGLLGRNGAGKTTALRLLLGFGRPSSGTIRLQGRDPMDPMSRIGVGYLPERLELPAQMSVHPGGMSVIVALASSEVEARWSIDDRKSKKRA